MKTLILLVFMLIANVFAGEAQETMCRNKSLSYCINYYDRQCKAKNYGACLLSEHCIKSKSNIVKLKNTMKWYVIRQIVRILFK